MTTITSGVSRAGAARWHWWAVEEWTCPKGYAWSRSKRGEEKTREDAIAAGVMAKAQMKEDRPCAESLNPT